MAAINFSVNLVETGNNGSGPYTITLLQNPTAATGGTDVSANAGTVYFGGAQVNLTTNPVGTINPQELMAYAAHVFGDIIAAANQQDPLN